MGFLLLCSVVLCRGGAVFLISSGAFLDCPGFLSCGWQRGADVNGACCVVHRSALCWHTQRAALPARLWRLVAVGIVPVPGGMPMAGRRIAF